VGGFKEAEAIVAELQGILETVGSGLSFLPDEFREKDRDFRFLAKDGDFLRSSRHPASLVKDHRVLRLEVKEHRVKLSARLENRAVWLSRLEDPKLPEPPFKPLPKGDPRRTRFSGGVRHFSAQSAFLREFLRACLRESNPSPLSTPHDDRVLGALEQAGWEPNPNVRHAIQKYAENRARQQFQKEGWRVEPPSVTYYDLLCTKGSQEKDVEVKGTTTKGRCILVTAAEVEHARANPERSVLFIVHSIHLKRDDRPTCSRGITERRPWRPSEGSLRAITYQYCLPDEH
jgi:hypothetical protein